MNEWQATKVHMYAQALRYLPEKTYWHLTPQLKVVIIEVNWSLFAYTHFAYSRFAYFRPKSGVSPTHNKYMYLGIKVTSNHILK